VKFLPAARAAIVVPVHNRITYTTRLLSQLAVQDFPEALVIVVDDGSTDGTAGQLATEFPDVVVLPGDGHLWWSGAVNVGCRYAIERGAETLILFNNDNSRVSLNCVSELVRCVAEFGGCAASVAIEEGSPPRIRAAGGNLKWPTRGILLRDAGEVYRERPLVAECHWLPGMALAFPADVFTRLDGFDEHEFPQYRGDTDFTLRARALGRPCVVSYACWVANDPRQSGMNFYSRVSLKAFVNGLFSLKSNYQLRSTISFARRYCPPRFIPIHLALFYLRYVYATLKTWLPSRPHPAAPR
jgi:GT2 family glycosyltransferase